MIAEYEGQQRKGKDAGVDQVVDLNEEDDQYFDVTEEKGDDGLLQA